MILDMEKDFGLKAWPANDPAGAPNASRFFEKVRGAATGVRLKEGVYRFDEPVDDFNVHLYGEPGCGLIRNFPADNDTQAMLTVRNLYSGQFIDIGFVSSANCPRNGKGTGALVACIPRAGEQVTSSKWKSVNFTSAAPTGTAYHKHNLYLDGTWGGTAPSTCIRTMDMNDCTFFGTENEANGGSALFVKGVSSLYLTGGGLTWSAGKAADLVIDGGPGGGGLWAQSAHLKLMPNACMKIRMQNCNDVQLFISKVWGDVVRGANVDGIYGIGRLSKEVGAKLVGKWGVGTGAVWQDY